MQIVLNFLLMMAIMMMMRNLPGVQLAQLRRVWMQDHCQNGICSGIHIGRNDYVIMSQAPIAKQIMLTFVNSSIAKIPHLMFDTFPDLQVLRLENCSVETFERPQFDGAKLKELNLADNQLELLPPGVFATMRKLLDLNLAGNRLELFPRGIFDKNLNLTRVNLARNRFKVFESELFKMQPRLTLLDLSGLILQELTLNFPILESIVANNCDLRKLTVYGIVKELELRNNSLREIPHIPNASNVTSLDLSHNPLGNLQGNPLRRYTGLLRLNLSATNMHDLPEGVFKKQNHLKLLDISSNSLYNLKFIIFDSLKSLQYFYFQQNNWNCDFLQLLLNSFVKRRDISFMEDIVEPELVDDYIDGVACWYENTKSSRHCESGTLTDAALELSIVRNDIKTMMETMDKKFVKIYRILEEMKLRL
uniref:Uncharacterized protein n=1 Tax=Glossina morsitans morsitans TaxID=37546 RepID=A0A1B0GCW6_GLOMM